MPDFTLSTRRADAATGRGGLQPDLIKAGGGMQVRPGFINPNAGNIVAAKGPVPNMVENQVLPGMMHLMEVTSKSAFAYQERESTFLANEAALKYAEEARKAYDGHVDSKGNFVPGYKQSTFEGTIAAYGAFSQALDDRFKDITEEMEPRVKQKALLAMQSYRNTYMGKAATHRTSELSKAESRQNYVQQQDLIREFTADPDAIARKNPYTGLDGRAQFYKLFKGDIKAANKAWYDAIQNIGETKYLNAATADIDPTSIKSPAQQKLDNLQKASVVAIDYYTQWGHMINASPKHISAMKGNILRWSNKATEAYNSSKTLEYLENKRKREAKYRDGTKKLYEDEARGNIWSPMELADAVKNNELDPKVERSFFTHHYGELRKFPNKELVQRAREAILEDVVNGNQYSLAYLRPEFAGLTSESRSNLEQFVLDVTDVNFQDRYSRGLDRIKNWTKGSNVQRSLNAQQLESIGLDAEDALNTMLRAKDMSYESIMDSLFYRYNPTEVSYKLLRPLYNGSRPDTPADITKEAEKIILDYNNGSGIITEVEMEFRTKQINRYIRLMEDRIRARREHEVSK